MRPVEFPYGDAVGTVKVPSKGQLVWMRHGSGRCDISYFA